MAVIAKFCPEHKIMVVDINQDRIDNWNSDNLPIYEPGLLEVVQEARGRNLFFHSDIAEATRDADIIFGQIRSTLSRGRSEVVENWGQKIPDIDVSRAVDISNIF